MKPSLVWVSVDNDVALPDLTDQAMLHALGLALAPRRNSPGRTIPLPPLPSGPVGNTVTAATVVPEPPAFRKLFSDPGIRRVLVFGDWKESLKGQLTDPKLLRDSHRLACFVQAVDVHSQSRIESVSKLLFDDREKALTLMELTNELTERLDLSSELLQQPPDRSAKRLFFLRVESDPTVNSVKPPSPTPVAAPLKRTVPEQYLRGAHFTVGREEALYDMQQPSTRMEQWRNAFKRAAFEKWQCLLWGKNLEDQLWTVRPPRDMLRDARVRMWAEKTLGAAGYDKQSMLSEWEIFWRQQGQ